VIWVYNQAWRMRTEGRFHRLLDDYVSHHPDTRVLLLEPSPDDAVMFMYSPMNFAARRVILEDGFKTTQALLADAESPLRKAFEAKGLVHKSEIAPVSP
jgi:hypothetical protein